MKKLFTKNKINKKGFVIPFALLISTIILTISLGVSLILVKEIYFSKLSKDSLLAYYAADEALDCAIHLDSQYQSGPNHKFFPVDDPNAMDLAMSVDYPAYTVSDLVCDTSKLNNIDTGVDCTYSPANTTTGGICMTKYNVKMDLGGGNFRCADILVDNFSSSQTIYKATGYSSCSGTDRVERTISR